MAKIKQPFMADDLAPCDLILAVHGPWHEGADCETRLGPTVFWHPRCRPDYLRRLWSQHQATIEQAATKAGLPEPWISSRLFFVDILEA